MTLKNTYQTVVQNMGSNSTYDWYSALCILTIALLIVFIMNSVFFFTFNSAQGTEADTASATTISLKQADIDTAVKNVRQRDGAPNNIPPVVRIDPSF